MDLSRFFATGDNQAGPEVMRRRWGFLFLALLATTASASDGVAADEPKRLCKIRIVDGMTGQPLEGIKVRVPSEDSAKKSTLTSDAAGLIEVPVPYGSLYQLKAVSPGWWSLHRTFVGMPESKATAVSPDDPAAPDPAKIAIHKLWPGTVVTGRLLLPNSEPAPGVLLNVGVYVNSMPWRKRLGMNTVWHSWDHGQWPNWYTTVVTDKAGKFETTVLPPDARSWVRIGTTSLSLDSIDPAKLRSSGPRRAWAKFAPFECEIGEPATPLRATDIRLNFGDLQLERGITLRGRVLSAEGEGLAGVILPTSGKHGPYAGRKAISDENGQFEFLPMAPGRTTTIRPDARLRDANGKVVSRDVSAVFLPQEVTLPDGDGTVETTIQAVPHITLEFTWIDRRAKKGSVAHHGNFRVSGHVPTAGGSMVSWRGETTRTRRDGRETLSVKVPKSIQDPALILPANSVVAASYEDEQQKCGPGKVMLGDVTQPQQRTIYGDEPAVTQ